MDTKIDLEHIKSLKEFSRGNMMFFGWSVSRWSTEDPDIFLVRFGTREGLISYIVVVGKKRFAFGIEGDLARSLKGYETDQLMNVWIDQILCEVIERSSTESAYIDFGNQRFFSSQEERDVIVDLFCRIIVADDEVVRGKIIKSRVMFTSSAKEQLADDRIVGSENT